MSTERTIEAIVIAILQTGDLASVPIRHHDEDASTLTVDGEFDAGPSRIVVRCDPPVPHLPGKNPSVTPSVMEASVTVTARGVINQKTAEEFDAWAAAVDALLQPASYPAAAVTAATTAFPLGFVLDVPNQGSRWQGTTTTRERTRGLRIIFRP